MVEICYWADGTWCYMSEINQYQWMSDDFSTIRLLEDTLEKEIEEIIDYKLR